MLQYFFLRKELFCVENFGYKRGEFLMKNNFHHCVIVAL